MIFHTLKFLIQILHTPLQKELKHLDSINRIESLMPKTEDKILQTIQMEDEEYWKITASRNHALRTLNQLIPISSVRGGLRILCTVQVRESVRRIDRG